ncbi:MAG: hypothetical protein Q8K43_08350 [Sulfurimicrobium sp.]|jgi:hypothetical protein|nr:hypothetical protein [Sulfurimicrobium sp.]MDP1705618.1 hypothetical protein [Sulfurimicrobium sp.]MDP1897881.1 hypothetical protein [Sulfurimicrobium sp.]MDP2198107.1 hypothetical protein [Sulfurimicrobium sp.]MDP2964237.1 hypothetical protein [Sulfurimicrobium sp.]
MFEYMFFDEELRQRFASYAGALGIECTFPADSMGLLAATPEDINEAVSDKLDTYYDELMAEQADRVDASDYEATHQAAGVRVTLSDGRPCMIKLEPALANRLLAAFTLEEMQLLVNTIALSVENPENGPLCKR